MQQIIISTRDQETSDLILTAFKQFPGIMPHAVNSPELTEAARNSACVAIVTDLDPDQVGHADQIHKLRQVAPNAEICLISKGKRPGRLAQQKREFSLFTTIQRPINAFDVARKILRLQAHLNATRPATVGV